MLAMIANLLRSPNTLTQQLIASMGDLSDDISIDQLADDKKYYHHLRQLLKAKARLDVKTSKNPFSLQSMLLAIDLKNNCLIIDDVFPQPASKIISNDKLDFEFNDNGIVTSFSSQLIKRTTFSGLAALVIDYPAEVIHDQRRTVFRLNLENNIAATLSADRYQRFYGVVKDISHQGLRINLSGNQNDQLSQGDVLSNCSIKLEDNKNIECQLIVRSKRYFNRPYRHTQIGAEISQIQQHDKNRLSQFINQQQRLLCKTIALQQL